MIYSNPIFKEKPLKFLKGISFSIICSIIVVWSFFPSLAFSLEPNEILILANINNKYSIQLSKYYMKKRNIPEANLLRLMISDKETCDRDDYEKMIASPVRKYIEEKDTQRIIRCLLIMYGLPLKITGTAMDKNIEGKVPKNPDASLDSELALVLEEGYILSGMQPNPFFVGYGQRYEARRDNVLMVSRLDGPSEMIVRRIIDDSIATEKKGLKGKAYLDARWPRNPSMKKEKTGYKLYDNSLFLAADLIRESGIMPVDINDKPELYQKGECPDSALYCGWYSLGRYVDAFDWKPGSVGYHIASKECLTLKRSGSQVWCKRMLEEGISATMGPVSEPFVEAFPLPELFFKFLIDGYWNLAECYALSQPYWSWQMVLIGDPLYRPFKNKK